MEDVAQDEGARGEENCLQTLYLKDEDARYFPGSSVVLFDYFPEHILLWKEKIKLFRRISIDYCTRLEFLYRSSVIGRRLRFYSCRRSAFEVTRRCQTALEA